MRVGLSELYLHLAWFFRTNTQSGEEFKKPGNAECGHGGMDGDDGMGGLERTVGFGGNYSPLSRIRPFWDGKQEIALQGLLVHLKGLLNAAANEPRLKVLVPRLLKRIGEYSRTDE